MTSQKHILQPAIIMLCFGFLAITIAFGIRSSFGLFIEPWHQTIGYSIVAMSIVFAIQNLVWGIVQPFVGAWSDTRGATPVMLSGGIVYVVGLLLMAFSENIFLFGLGGGIFVGFAIAALGFPIISGALGRCVPPDKRDLFFGISTAGGSFGQALFAPWSKNLIDHIGINETLYVLAMMCIIASLCGLAFRGDKPQHKKDFTHKNNAITDIKIPLKLIIKDALKHRGYLFLTSGFFVCGFQLAFMTIHLPPYLSSHHLDSSVGALVISAIGIANIFGTIIAGYIGGKWNQKIPLASIYLLRSILVILFISFPVTEISAIIFAICFGLLWLSTIPLTIGVIVRIYGANYIGTLYGLVFLNHQLGSFIGLLVAGWSIEATGDYNLIWWISIALGIFAFIIHLPINTTKRDLTQLLKTV
ncbi:MAG: MFS transporter [Pseudomonadota bacterium]